jgi:hypothetical protein
MKKRIPWNKGKKLSREHVDKIQESRKGYRHSEETKMRLSQYKGIKHWAFGKPKSEELKRKNSEGHKGERNVLFGKHLPEETKRKIGESNKGNKKRLGSKQSEESRRKISENLSGEKHPNFGKHLSDKTRRKISEANKGRICSEETKKLIGNSNRIKLIERIQQNIADGLPLVPFFNRKACKIIDDYGIKNGYNFQHAMNGGEYYIKELGYWLDGYDKDKNVAIEIDERHHFDVTGELKNKDIIRQKEIEQFLKCTFIRIKFDDFKGIEDENR